MDMTTGVAPAMVAAPAPPNALPPPTEDSGATKRRKRTADDVEETAGLAPTRARAIPSQTENPEEYKVEPNGLGSRAVQLHVADIPKVLEFYTKDQVPKQIKFKGQDGKIVKFNSNQFEYDPFCKFGLRVAKSKKEYLPAFGKDAEILLLNWTVELMEGYHYNLEDTEFRSWVTAQLSKTKCIQNSNVRVANALQKAPLILSQLCEKRFATKDDIETLRGEVEEMKVAKFRLKGYKNGGLSSTSSALHLSEAQQLAGILGKGGYPARIPIDSASEPGKKKRINCDIYSYDENAPYLLKVKASELFLLPNGKEVDKYVCGLIRGVMKSGDFDMSFGIIEEKVAKKLSEKYAVYKIEERVTNLVTLSNFDMVERHDQQISNNTADIAETKASMTEIEKRIAALEAERKSH
jgi:hypothetical protein